VARRLVAVAVTGVLVVRARWCGSVVVLVPGVGGRRVVVTAVLHGDASPGGRDRTAHSLESCPIVEALAPAPARSRAAPQLHAAS
jgi:hypothetical protein